MTYTIYADVLFVINFLADFFCIFFSLHLCRLKKSIFRILLSSVLGGIYSVFSLFINEDFFIIFHILCLILICTIATCKTDAKNVLKLSGVFFIVSAFLGGIITAVFSYLGKFTIQGGILYADISPFTLLFLFFVIAVLSIPAFTNARNRISAKTVLVKIKKGKETLSFDALVDTGNLLTDPLSCDAVILIKSDEMTDIFSKKELSALKNLDVLSEDFPRGIRLIPTEKGLIPIFRPEDMEIVVFSKKSIKNVCAVIGIDFSNGTFAGAKGLLPACLI